MSEDAHGPGACANAVTAAGPARPARHGPWRAGAAYVVLALALTWPLALGLAHDVPSDMGDPLLNTWIVTWDAKHLLAAASGNLSTLAGYWHPGIFYPQPYALAYSEHLTAQAVQILPVYAITRNSILCYNLLFLSTFALSALGMFLFVRELTGSSAAGFVAGLAFGFAPYRFGTLSHLQVLSSAWMPFTLYGLRRFFDTGRSRPLAGAAAAWLAQNLSCGYYLLFFSPVVVAYMAWEVTTRRLWTSRGTILRLAAACAVVFAATAPFVVPYLRLRALGFDPRSLAESDHFAADTWAYFTAEVTLRFWGRVARAWPAAEGYLFPGLTIVALAATGAAKGWTAPAAGRSGRLARLLAAAAWIAAAATVALGLGWSLRTSWLRVTDLDRTAITTMLLAVAALAASPANRRKATVWARSPAGFFVLVTVAAVVLSFGPTPHARGRIVEARGPYALLYWYVPGFDGIRVPARLVMIAILGLAALAGLGAARLARRPRGRTLVAVAAILILIESFAVPIPVNTPVTGFGQPGLRPLPGTIGLGTEAPPVYRFVAALPASAVLLELPFGEPAHEVRYMLYALDHGRRLVNGYSGGAPLAYALLREDLVDVLADPERAWTTLIGSGATHVIVHEAAYEPGRGARISQWLIAHGAREVDRAGDDRVFALPAPLLSTGRPKAGSRAVVTPRGAKSRQMEWKFRSRGDSRQTAGSAI